MLSLDTHSQPGMGYASKGLRRVPEKTTSRRVRAVTVCMCAADHRPSSLSASSRSLVAEPRIPLSGARFFVWLLRGRCDSGWPCTLGCGNRRIEDLIDLISTRNAQPFYQVRFDSNSPVLVGHSQLPGQPQDETYRQISKRMQSGTDQYTVKVVADLVSGAWTQMMQMPCIPRTLFAYLRTASYPRLYAW